jgi:PleD family two-component response regulator
MTFGVATLGDDSTIADCIRQADDALYRGKTEGRNRVVCAA